MVLDPPELFDELPLDVEPLDEPDVAVPPSDFVEPALPLSVVAPPVFVPALLSAVELEELLDLLDPDELSVL
ncbi:MAG: hypothetical protein ACO3D1_02880 [Ilumatobacteraceae bacterium]